MQNYLFVHFREKSTPDGEQVRFGLSRDGFHWEAVNGGEPVLWAYHGDKGVRDFTVVRCDLTGKFYIIATDLSLSYGFRNQYHHLWGEITRNGSHCFSLWESPDLVNWSEQKLIPIVGDDFGCCWAPDVIKDKATGDYILHWSSPLKADNYEKMSIYYSRTRDFEHFSKPELLFGKETLSVIDSAIYEENGMYYLFLKGGDERGSAIELYTAPSVTGPYTVSKPFSDCMEGCRRNYEAPTAVKLDDGQWALFVDFYGARGAGQGYVPFLSNNIGSGIFARSDADFSFPYGFKHGTILPITEEEYERIQSHDWSDKGW